MGAHVCTCVNMSGVGPQDAMLSTFEMRALTNLELTRLARLTVRHAPGILLSLSRCWDYDGTLSCHSRLFFF